MASTEVNTMVLTLQDEIRSTHIPTLLTVDKFLHSTPQRFNLLGFADPTQVISDPIGVDIGTPTPIPTSIINFSATSTEVVAGGTVTFTGQVLDQNGNPMGGVTVTLQIHQGQETQDNPTYTITTDNTGTFSAQHIFMEVGTFYAFVHYQTQFKSNDLRVDVTPIPTTPSTLTLDASPLSIEVGEKVTFTGALTDLNNNPIEDHPVYVDIKQPSADGTLQTIHTINLTTEQQSGAYWTQYSFNTAGNYIVQAHAPKSMAFGVTFPETETKTIKVYEQGERPILPEWVLPAIGIGAVAIAALAIGYGRVKK